MEQREKTVDGFRFLPPGLAAWVRKFIPEEEFRGFIPWTPLAKPLSQATLALVTSAGISLKTDPPFDMEREKKEAIWGDRSYRAIREGPQRRILKSITSTSIRTTSNGISTSSFLWPRMAEFEQEKIIGRLALTSYSFYGFQWQNTDFLKKR